VTASLLLHGAAIAAEKLTVAVTAPYGWDSSVVGYGNRLGYFSEQGLDVVPAYTDVVAQNLQAVIAGSADAGIVAVPQFMAARIQGAPVVMVASVFKGVPDFLWFVRSDSPLHSFKDLKPENTIGVSALGSTSHILVKTLLDQVGTDAKIVPVGASAAGLVQVMAGQLDVSSDGNGLLGVPEFQNNQIRVLAYGSELAELDDVTVRGLIVREDTLAKRRDALIRFLQAYQKTIDWMYADPKALEWFAEGTKSTLAEATRVRDHSYPPGHLNVEAITGVDVTIRQSLDNKRIDRAPTADEIAAMFQTIWSRQ
jgi:NitT/TauT family transport system substrate-binding protein